MLDHVSITVDDMARAEPFYDAAMAALGVVKVGARPDWLGYGVRSRPGDDRGSYLSIRLGDVGPFVQGRHWCFKAADRSAVDAFWQAGLAAGGIDDGKPGLRPYHESYYAAFLRDPCGNRLEAVCHAPALGDTA